MLLAARDITGGIQWCKDNKDNANIAADAEKAKKRMQERKLRERNLVLSVLGRLVFWWLMRQTGSEWMYMDAIHIYR